MFRGISGQRCALGPIQAIFLFSGPGVAVLLQTLHRGLIGFRQGSGRDDMAADGFYQLKHADPPGALLDTAVTGGAGPGGLIDGDVGGPVQRDIPEDLPGTVACNLVPGANPGAGAALHAALEGIADILPHRSQVSRRLTQGLGFQGGQEDGQRPVHQMGEFARRVSSGRACPHRLPHGSHRWCR